MSKDSQKSLENYRNKRDFRRTSEPEGKSGKSNSAPVFVIQKHDAQNLHYDFRLEVDGVLKSWAVPKGPSTDPAEKRLAVPTEDHPLDYADFEGNIPEGNYGAGSVIVWDRGTYQNITEKDGRGVSMDDAIEGGHVSVRLSGEKIHGGYALVRTGSGDDKRWLLIKMKDDHADARRNPVSTEPKSVLSGKTVEEVAKENE
ncbi:MAG: DNA polymerase ligase N-terminal domain-containing protein [Bacillota bacterium]|nr:DNA polymerase ligase N-terminal domain-containing protein [Bacillota bacterium]MDW7684847.1 DNA polymerase ligase N-terminal domain-containing protein [Bacillota bacterium]